MVALRRHPWRWAGAGLGFLLLAAVVLRPKPTVQPLPKPQPAQRLLVESVSALGRLEPAGDVRKLAAP
ncbi:MAG: lipid ABC transporter permease, partial [Synechococcaceae bacterium WB9_2_170]|nr:lipid ABC transporter permease [Synechococcaceae bacterium WB9_2_170]